MGRGQNLKPELRNYDSFPDATAYAELASGSFPPPDTSDDLKQKGGDHLQFSLDICGRMEETASTLPHKAHPAPLCECMRLPAVRLAVFHPS
jgi:hypothetical protein